jgi:hypothetical protein|tara:strand:- start:2025 stop:2276 length:252 start_codon:yes stop_codon:yes gene_type:complete
MIYLTYTLISFILSITILEYEVHKTSRSLVGNALARCNIIERIVFYVFPLMSDIYILLIFVERKYPRYLPDIDWKAYSKHSVF